MNITNIKGYAISTLITFVAVFLTTFASTIVNPGFVFGKDTLIALAVSAIISAVRAVAKLVIEFFSGVVTNPVITPAVSTPTSSTTIPQ